MAGLVRFPGVDLPPRRRKQTRHREAYAAKYREPYMREWLEPSVTSMDLNEAAHKSRRRLEKRLGYNRPSSRTKHVAVGSNSNSRLLARSWGFFSLSRIEKEADREVCSICLENFQAEQKAMDLSCAHKFHSSCLVPWLSCPSRLPVL